MKVLTLRLNDREHERLKAAANKRNVSMHAALLEGMELWLHGPRGESKDLLSFEGCLSGTNALDELETEHQAEIARENRA